MMMRSREGEEGEGGRGERGERRGAMMNLDSKRETRVDAMYANGPSSVRRSSSGMEMKV